MASLVNEMAKQGHEMFNITLDPSLVPNKDDLAQFTALEDVILIGYPNGIWDSTNNLPIIRRGVTATHHAIDHDGRKEFMLDAACVPGSSGSPVCLFNPSGWTARTGGMVVGARVKLLGVLYAGPQHTAEGRIQIVTVPTRQAPVALSRIPNNLGLVIKAQRLLEFEPVLKKMVK